MTTQALEITRSSASMWGSDTGIRKTPIVAKYIDTSTCIGCKACEAACQEWNDLPPLGGHQTGTYQTNPELHSDLWNLIRFSEQDTAEGFAWLMRKDQCMHCSDPGCLKACPAPGAIVQYGNGIVDVDPTKCIGCGYCATGCPFDVPKFSAKTGKMSKCTLCVDRVEVGLEPACVKSCPTGCLNFGTKDDMVALGLNRVKQLKDSGFKDAVLYNPEGVGGTGVVTVLKFNRPDWYGLPVNPQVPLLVRAWKSLLRPVGIAAAIAAFFGTFVHYTSFGPKEPSDKDLNEPAA